MNKLCKLLAITAVALDLIPAQRAYAVADLQVFRASLSLTGTLDLTAAGPLDWVHWGYQVQDGAMGGDAPKPDRKALAGTMLIGNFQIQPPSSKPATYWMHTTSTRVSFAWDDGTPNPSALSVTDGITGIAETAFTLSAAAATELRELSIYVSADCRDGVQLNVTLGGKAAELTTTEICDKQLGPEDHKLTIRYSSDDQPSPSVTLTFRAGVFGATGPTIYAATLAPVSSSGPATGRGGGGGPADLGGAAGTAASSGGAGQSGGAGGGGGSGGSGGAGRDGGAGDGAAQAGQARLLACGVAPAGRDRPETGAIAALVIALVLAVRLRHRPWRRISR